MHEHVYKILVVDDEEAMRLSLADLLRLEGYWVQTASGGLEAIQEIQICEFDLAFLDLRMPGMDGLEVLTIFANTCPDMQVILLTAHGSLESAIIALRFGASDYLLKPASPSQICSSAGRAVRRRQDMMNRRHLLDQLESSIHVLRGSHLTTQPEQVEIVILLDHQVKINFDRREIRQGDRSVGLTPAENKLLKILTENQGRLLSHRELVAKVQGYSTSDQEAPGIMRPLISRLRRKLEQIQGCRNWISNVRGAGYIFNLNE